MGFRWPSWLRSYFQPLARLSTVGRERRADRFRSRRQSGSKGHASRIVHACPYRVFLSLACIGLSRSGYMKEDPNEIHQVVRTTDAEFSIKTAVMKDQQVEVTLDSNLEIPVLCLLFNNKGMN